MYPLSYVLQILDTPVKNNIYTHCTFSIIYVNISVFVCSSKSMTKSPPKCQL